MIRFLKIPLRLFSNKKNKFLKWKLKISNKYKILTKKMRKILKLFAN
jgi:hypothetical protein